MVNIILRGLTGLKIILDLPTGAMISYQPMEYKVPENDRTLIEACLKKDFRAWSELISRHSKLVHISIENRLKKCGVTLPPHDVEDISQDVFTTIWKENKLRLVANRDDIRYWLSIVAGNAAIDHVRRPEIRESFKTVSLYEKFQDKDLSDIIPAGIIKPEDDKAEINMAESIDKAIAALKSQEKLIIKLHLLHGKKYHEIADMLNMPKNTVSSCVRRAKENLKKRLRELR